jgi:nuclear protein localization family protein 4
VATEHDLAEMFQLRATTGWQTLQAILQSTGERNPKRSRAADDGGGGDGGGGSRGSGGPASLPPLSRRESYSSSDERLAKRIAGVRLGDDRAHYYEGGI